MARVGVHGKIEGTTKYDSETVAILAWLFNVIENTLNGQIDSTNLADYVSGVTSVVTTAKINDLAVTAAKIALATITPAQTADTVGQTYSGNYTGDGATANRVISIGFTPRYVLVVRTDATFITFEAQGDGASTTFWYRDAAGAQAASTANWQGVVAGGFKLGTAVGGTANVAAVVYRITAWK